MDLEKLAKNGFRKRFIAQNFEEWILDKFAETYNNEGGG